MPSVLNVFFNEIYCTDSLFETNLENVKNIVAPIVIGTYLTHGTKKV